MQTFTLSTGERIEGVVSVKVFQHNGKIYGYLLRFKHHVYMYIGLETVKFRALEKIVKVRCVVTGSGIAYNYGIDRDGHYYLFLEKMIILNLKNKNTPYSEFYIESVINDPSIEGFWVDEEPYTPTYGMKYLDNMEIKFKYQSRKKLDIETYNDIMKTVALEKGFQPFTLE